MKKSTYAEKEDKPGPISQRQVDQPRAGQATREMAPPILGSVPRHDFANLPAEPGARALRQSAVLQMQRERGNTYVARAVQLQPHAMLVQRDNPVEPPEAVPAVEGEPPGAESTPGGATPTEMTAGGSAVRVTPGAVEISGGMVNVDAPMTRFSGAVQSDTLIANSVISSTYTPGAGNVW